MRVGQIMHQRLEVSSAGGDSTWEGAQLWGALCTHQKGCGDTEGTAMKTCIYPGAAGSDKAWREWHGNRDNSTVG